MPIDFKINGTKLNWANHTQLGVEMVPLSSNLPSGDFFKHSETRLTHENNRVNSMYLNMYDPSAGTTMNAWGWVVGESYINGQDLSLRKAYFFKNYVHSDRTYPNGTPPWGTYTGSYFSIYDNVVSLNKEYRLEIRIVYRHRQSSTQAINYSNYDETFYTTTTSLTLTPYESINSSTALTFINTAPSVNLHSSQVGVALSPDCVVIGWRASRVPLNGSYDFVVPVRIYIDSIKELNPWKPNATDGYVDVDGLFNAGYQLVKIEDNAPQYLKDYCDFFKGHIKINYYIERYYCYESRPTGSLLTTLSTPGTYYLDVYERTTELKNSSGNVLSSFNSRIITLILQGGGGAGGKGAAHAWANLAQSGYGAGGGGGGGAGATAWCVLNLNTVVGCRIDLTVGAGGSTSDPGDERANSGTYSRMYVRNASNASVSISAGGGNGGKHAKKKENGYTLGGGGGGGNYSSAINFSGFMLLKGGIGGRPGGGAGNADNNGQKGYDGASSSSQSTDNITINNTSLVYCNAFSGGVGGNSKNKDNSIDSGGGGGGASGWGKGGKGGNGSNKDDGAEDGGTGAGGGGVGAGSYARAGIGWTSSTGLTRAGKGGDGFIKIYY